jgi:hypothetical protein
MELLGYLADSSIAFIISSFVFETFKTLEAVDWFGDNDDGRERQVEYGTDTCLNVSKDV